MINTQFQHAVKFLCNGHVYQYMRQDDECGRIDLLIEIVLIQHCKVIRIWTDYITVEVNVMGKAAQANIMYNEMEIIKGE